MSHRITERSHHMHKLRVNLTESYMQIMALIMCLDIP